MASGSLGVTIAGLRNRVSRYLGFGTHYTSINSDNQELVNRYVADGLRQYFHPPPVPDPKTGEQYLRHTWSFLVTATTAPLTIDVPSVDLESDFCDFVGEVFATDGSNNWRIQIVPEDVFARVQLGGTEAEEDDTRAARYGNVFWNEASRKYSFYVAPRPAASTTVYYAYRKEPDIDVEGDSGSTKVYGSEEHNQLVIASCLAAAELGEDDAQGPNAARFMSLLTAAIEADTQKLDSVVSRTFFGTATPTSYVELMRECGHALGMGRDDTRYTEAQKQELGIAIQNGLKTFYAEHEWSFLWEQVSFKTVIGRYGYGSGTIATEHQDEDDDDYDPAFDPVADAVAFNDWKKYATADLTSPTDLVATAIAAIDGPMIEEVDSPGSQREIPFVYERKIRELRKGNEDSLGRPTHASIVYGSWVEYYERDSDADGYTENHTVNHAGYSIIVWPTPSDEYTLTFRFRRASSELTNAADDDPLGWQYNYHRNTIIAACQRAATDGNRELWPIYENKYRQYMGKSIQNDRESFRPETLGLMRPDLEAMQMGDDRIKIYHSRVSSMIIGGVDVTP